MKTLLFLTFLLLANLAFAQTTVRGKFADENTLEAIPFATFAILKATDTLNFVATGTTDINGEFSAALTKNGSYQITLRCVGKATIVQMFEAHGNTADLGVIYTQDVDNQYGEVVIQAKKTRIVNEQGKTKYNADADPTQASSSVLEMIRKIPGLIVDGNDNISINSKNSFIVEVNGRKNLTITANASKSLKAMPASSVKSIEIITEPGAKYDAEGVGAVINLITDRKKSFDNTSGSLGFEVADRNKEANGTFCMQKKNFSASVSGWLDYSNDQISWQSIKTYQDGNQISQNIDDFETYTDDSHTMQYGFNVDLSYEFDTLNLLSVSASTYISSDKSYGDEIFRMTGAIFDQDYTYKMFDDYNERMFRIVLALIINTFFIITRIKF